ncbi:alpha/beta fold hydrolase [Jannaschia rubra]|uniref:Pimelyl-[acyl-carrier protein] methyl ester esterase n=1 Tax=Jannaschia rubra TaxID=282197 RepID=A0A0M6XU50_9RHOB|nr:alpha/beta fold hydrolase [Jannaschia rubra]CTQ33735.1 Pimelyl-[acyl-carrier protein] methyl ester esterase [Jannaschia rubra]SFG07728.1 Pimeloyl-ACP methyl ester carboxylesterase [Jannaschia rubra]
MTALLLLPGMMCDARLFAPQIAAIHDRAVMIAPITGHDTTAALAAEVLAHAPPRFALAGLSMGGIVAMEMLAQAPDRIAGLCLMDTNPKAEHPEVAKGREPQIASVRDGGLRAVMRDEMKPNYLADGPRRGAILDTCTAMAEALGPAVFVRQSRALQTRADRQDTLATVTVPSLVLCGRDDALCPLHRHEAMHDLLEGSTLVVVEGAGHLPTLEQPEVTTRALRSWLDRVDRA